MEKVTFSQNIKMETQMQKFKTNINCGGCIEKIKPHLDNVNQIKNWSVDTTNSDKILLVDSSLTAQEIITIVEKAGFKLNAL